jgi:hypothetical protein
MQIATLVIAVVGVSLAVLSIAWQAATFILTGPRVKVELHEGLRGPLGVMVASLNVYTDDGRAALERSGYDEHVLAITAINNGRLPATITSWSVRFGNGASQSVGLDRQNPELPYRLEAHSSATWYMLAEHAQGVQRVFADQGRDASKMRGEVGLASGKRTARSPYVLGVDPTGVYDLPRPMMRRVARRIRHPRRPAH